MWACSSSSISRFKRWPRTAFEMRDHIDISCLPENPVDCQADRLPARFFRAQLLFAGGGQFVDAGPAAGVFLDPLGANPARFLHPVQRRVERTFLGAQHFAGGAGDGRHDGVAVKPRPSRQDFQYQQIERTLQSIGLGHIQMSLYRYLSMNVKFFFEHIAPSMRFMVGELNAGRAHANTMSLLPNGANIPVDRRAEPEAGVFWPCF